MVVALERKYVDLDTENPLPYSQLNTEILEATTNGVNSLLVLLERKRAETHNCLQNYHPQRYLKKESADEIGRIEEVLRLYNTVVDPYNKTGITQQTKSEILSTVRKYNHRLLIL